MVRVLRTRLATFGSRARGEGRADSDLDVAVLLAGPIGLREELRMRAGIVELVGSDAVDLVLLGQARPDLRHEIVSTGQRLFARDEERIDDFEQRTAMECFDTAHLRAVQEELAREAVR